MMNRAALIGIMIEDNKVSKQINEILHEYSEYIIGRMGIPNVKENLSVISVVLNAPSDVINTISGKLGRIDGVTSKTIFSKAEEA
ncbi:MAG: TM1266 family iron-only hydrogenase system putative regulator [Acutalibacteraceae bacterium]|nr:iron-only hydrogenase system regulator [Clostridia bacterium]MEE3449915.1 TM1266 family iron-only hydrogenase system putative regulator [Acutalibacteraceae bacterium]